MEGASRALSPLTIAILSASNVAGGPDAYGVALPHGLADRGYGVAPCCVARRAQLFLDHIGECTVSVVATRLHPGKRNENAITAALVSHSARLAFGDGPARAEFEQLSYGKPDMRESSA